MKRSPVSPRALFAMTMLAALAPDAAIAAPLDQDATLALETAKPVWRRHTIDAGSRGADGVRLADVNGDGRPDVATGWEEGGAVRLYLNPGPAAAARPWPLARVGEVGSPEDAVAADLDGDGRFELVSATEGSQRTVYFHFAATSDPLGAWRTVPVPATVGKQRWMFVAPAQLDGRGGVDLVVGSKQQDAAVGWLQSPADPRDAAAWRYRALRPAGWIMTLLTSDMDGDGDADILFSDRTGERSGVAWLENPGAAGIEGPWREHAIGLQGATPMFIDRGDLDGDGRAEIVAAVQPRRIAIVRGSPRGGWRTQLLTLTGDIGTMKAVSVIDLNRDGRSDLVVSCENATGNLRGMLWIEQTAAGWRLHDLGGPDGKKFDLVPTADLNGDGWPDVLTTEETDGLGVVWYENPGAEASR